MSASTVPKAPTMAEPIYLDFNASTPIAPEAVAAFNGNLFANFGNPSSPHWAAKNARAAIDLARLQAADLLGCEPSEIVFTGSGTESSNTAIKGLFFRLGLPFHMITSAIEHPATLAPCRFLERLGATTTILPVDRLGRIDPKSVEEAIRPETKLISFMHANNETGVVQPIEAVGRIARRAKVVFHVDAAQSVGKIPVDVGDLGADLLSLAGHKLYAPKGVGLLYIREGVALEPLLHGASHEAGRRAGTEATPLIAALGAACAVAKEQLLRMHDTEAMRDYFWRRLQTRFGDGVVLHGHPRERLPNTLFVSFNGSIGAELLAGMEGVAATTGSACHTGASSQSPVLAAMGVDPLIGRGAIRFSLGRTTTQEEIDRVLTMLDTVVAVPPAPAYAENHSE